MQKTLFFIIIFLMSQTIRAQENESFHLYSLGYETGFYKAESANNWGAESNLIAAFKHHKNIFEGVVSFGVIGDFGQEDDNILEEITEFFTARFITVSALYGRDIPLSERLFFTGLAGPSYIYAADGDESDVGAHLKIRFNYLIRDRVTLGVSNNALLSSIDTKLSFNFFMNFRLK